MPDFIAVNNDVKPLKLIPALAKNHRENKDYIDPPGLREAADVAMMLGTPLLLTGEPGTGKTQAAYWLKRELKAPLLRHNVKSASSARSLLYSFDEVARFRDSNSSEENTSLVKYLQFNPLGIAIIRSAGSKAQLYDQANNHTLDQEFVSQNPEFVSRVVGNRPLASPEIGLTVADLLDPMARTDYDNPAHNIVLIDELDKAARDTPNDLLFEIENMAFQIDELGLTVKGDEAFRPIVLMTNNSEKSLPEPFLRRCTYFHIPLPDTAEDLCKIIEANIGIDEKTKEKPSGSQATAMADALLHLQSDSAVQKKPATSEFLAWVDCVMHNPEFRDFGSIMDFLENNKIKEKFEPLLGLLFKSKTDLEAGKRAFIQFARASKR